MDAAFKIFIGQGAADSSVSLNGVDITKHISGVTVDCQAGSLSEVTLRIRRADAELLFEAGVPPQCLKVEVER